MEIVGPWQFLSWKRGAWPQPEGRTVRSPTARGLRAEDILLFGVVRVVYFFVLTRIQRWLIVTWLQCYIVSLYDVHLVRHSPANSYIHIFTFLCVRGELCLCLSRIFSHV